MTWTTEWQELRSHLRDGNFERGIFQNQFYRHLTRVLVDNKCGHVDTLLAYRDALLSSADPKDAELPSRLKEALTESQSHRFGLKIRRNGNIALKEDGAGLNIDLAPIYRLEQRRYIHEEMLDPALQSRLNDPTYTHYRGKAQQLAVRIALTSKPNKTILVNLPTGCGKTLIAQALGLFAASNSLTVVIVPTIGLAIEQGSRAKQLLEKTGDAHSGIYAWHGGQTKEEHDEVKTRIKNQQQRILFCSPEAACRSLLPTLFQAAKSGSLKNIVVDEAHIVDQWGAEFRPYFQIIASLTQSLREISPGGLRCTLMSATFSNKSVRLLEELFGVVGEDVASINGSFLRPEIQYAVKKVREADHLEEVVKAIVALPKPTIVYVLYPEAAETIGTELRRVGITRVRVFTGKTPPDQREDLIRGWSHSEFDIVVATSAFGLGMDKPDIRSIIHAAVPENIDRYYQEVGRGGRDGRASQSLIIYHEKQIDEARKLNTQRLITVDLGFAKWKAMWSHGGLISTGGREVAISTIRGDQSTKSLGNEEWNWRTLLLMQRARIIRIEMQPPAPPDSTGQPSVELYRDSLRDYYDKYYETVMVTPLIDNIDDQATWSDHTSQRRDFEKQENGKAFTCLLKWLQNPTSVRLCDTLLDYYSISGFQPEYACGGCPSCLSIHRHVNMPTLGCSANASGVSHFESWSPMLHTAPSRKYVYFLSDARSSKRLVREWSSWLRRLIENRVIEAVCADAEFLQVLGKELKTRQFWIGEVARQEPDDENMFWPRLVIHTDKNKGIYRLGHTSSVSLLLGPEEAPDVDNPNRKWWQSTPNAVSLDNFLLSLDS